jgi:competence ComEA-like helix-hairpin-helix protein
MQVKGIGRGYAKGIVRFRRETGGFISVEQLREVYGMSPENFERIRSSCTVNIDLVRKINVNTATVERLNAHLYLNFYQSKAIYELRRKKGKLNGMTDLKGLSEFKPEDLSKIQPYLTFE